MSARDSNVYNPKTTLPYGLQPQDAFWAGVLDYKILVHRRTGWWSWQDFCKLNMEKLKPIHAFKATAKGKAAFEAARKLLGVEEVMLQEGGRQWLPPVLVSAMAAHMDPAVGVALVHLAALHAVGDARHIRQAQQNAAAAAAVENGASVAGGHAAVPAVDVQPGKAPSVACGGDDVLAAPVDVQWMQLKKKRKVESTGQGPSSGVQPACGVDVLPERGVQDSAET